MKKKMLHRALLGAPMGLAISYLITIAISLGWGGGAYNPCMPELIALTGSESGAVALQAAVACLVGAGFAGSSVVWEIEHWGLARQTGVYFLLLALFMLPAAYLTGSRRKPAGQSRRHCRWEAGRAAIEMEQPRRSVRAGRLFAGDLRRGRRSWGASTIPTFPRFHARQRFARNRSGRISWQPLGTWKP